MFNLFKTKINKTWGLDITDRHLRAVEIEGSLFNWKIKKISKIDLAAGVVENGSVKQPEILRDHILQLKKTAFPSPINLNLVNVNLNEEHTFMRTIQMPELASEEMEEAIQWEAESNIPLSIDKVYISYEELPKEKNEKKIPMLLAATPKAVIDKLIASLEEAKIKPIVIEPDSVALVRTLIQTDPSIVETTTLCINLKEHYTQMVVFDEGVVKLSTTCEISSQDFDKAIETKFKIGNKEAEKIRRQVSWNEKNDLAKQLQETTLSPFNNLKKEINDALSFYQSNFDKEIKKIILIGEKKSKWPGFDQFLSGEIKLPISWQSGWGNEKWPNKCPFAQEETAEFNIGIGLALRKLENTF